MRVSPPVSESEFEFETISSIDATDDEFLVHTGYLDLQNDHEELENALTASQNARASLEAEVAQLKGAQAMMRGVLDEALAEKTQLANQLQIEREAAGRNLLLLHEEKTRNEVTVKTIRREHEAALRKSNNETQEIRAELNRLKLAPQSAYQTLGGRTVDELAEGLLRAFAGPKANFVAGRSETRSCIKN